MWAIRYNWKLTLIKNEQTEINLETFRYSLHNILLQGENMQTMGPTRA